jgi:hypothetical protein
MGSGRGFGVHDGYEADVGKALQTGCYLLGLEHLSPRSIDPA